MKISFPIDSLREKISQIIPVVFNRKNFIFSLLVKGNYFRQELAVFNQQAAERRSDAIDFFTANQKNNAATFTVIHLMSCHAPYQIRYPAGFADHLELDYEKATAYLDTVLEKLFKFAMSDPEIKGILFIPDHGEDVKIGDHDSAGFTIDMTKIPMICYFSDS